MKVLVRILGRLFLALAVLFVIGLVYSTAKGYMTWYFRVDGVVTIDGRATGGYLHANTQKTILLLTRTDEKTPETYFVPLNKGTTVFDCGDWQPVRFLPIPIGDLNTRCPAIAANPPENLDAAADSTLVRTARSIEFVTTSGKKVKAEF
jgi:hypothetical protein